jgi:CRISPR-associated protein Csd2
MTEIKRATGLLVIEVRNCNPNGDPERESDPRTRSHDGKGIITGVSFKRKLRDLVEDKSSDIWKTISGQLDIKEPDDYSIMESRDRGFADVQDATDAWKKVIALIDSQKDGQAVANKYWDARIFGATFLEKDEKAENPDGSAGVSGKEAKGKKKDRKYIRTGVIQFGLGLSIARVRIERGTLTKKTSAQEGKDRGMAPFGDRHIEHGVYCMPFFVNPVAARQSGCKAKDIALLLALLKCAYAGTKSVSRNLVEVRHAWYGEHEDSLGSFSEFAFIDALTPSKKDKNNNVPSSLSMDKEYDVPQALPDTLKDRVKNFCDLSVKLPDWCKNA